MNHFHLLVSTALETSTQAATAAQNSGIASIDTSTMSGKMDMGFQVLILGMLIIFAVLAILWIALLLFKFFCYDLPNKLKKEKNNTEITNEELLSSSVNEEQMIAAITAAIMASQEETPQTRFRVVSFRRIS